MKDLLKEIEEDIYTKVDFNLTSLQERIKSLECGNSSILFWKNAKTEKRISILRENIRRMDKFLKDELLFLSYVNNYYFLDLPSFENIDFSSIILNGNDYNIRLRRKNDIMNYLNTLKRFLSLENEDFASCIFDRREAEKRGFNLEEKFLYSISSLQFLTKKEEKIDSSVKAYLGFLLPEQLNFKENGFQNVWEINYVALRDGFDYHKYLRTVQDHMLYQELKEMFCWKNLSQDYEVSKEVLLKSKQRILILFSKLKDLQFDLENEAFLQTENFLANILVDITNNLMNQDLQTLK